MKDIAATAVVELRSLKRNVEDKRVLREFSLVLLTKFNVLALGRADKRKIYTEVFRGRVCIKRAYVRAVVMVLGRG